MSQVQPLYRRYIIKFVKVMLYFFVGLSLLGLGAAILLNSTGLAKRMDDWLLIPRPERFTELYFAEHQKLPNAIQVGATQNIVFTVYNLEHRNTDYHYEIIAISEDGSTTYPLGEGTFMLVHNQLQNINKNFALPAISGRITIKINLNYSGILAASNETTLQTQSIHWWVDAVPHASDSEGYDV